MLVTLVFVFRLRFWSDCHLLIRLARLGDFEKSLLRVCMSCTQRQCVTLSWCLSVIGSDSMTVYLSSMMTRKPCKVHASLTENTMMVKYSKKKGCVERESWTDRCGQTCMNMYRCRNIWTRWRSIISFLLFFFFYPGSYLQETCKESCATWRPWFQRKHKVSGLESGLCNREYTG